MLSPDFEAAKGYILSRFEHDLPKNLVYHSAAHTCEIVIPAIEYLSEHEGLTPSDLRLLKTAAYYHDIGFVKSHLDHELNSIQIARETLPSFGYHPAQIDLISGIILATHIPQLPQTHLEEIMADADLDILGRADYWGLNQLLRMERASYGCQVSDAEWYREQLDFMHAHHYFTPTALQRRETKKQQHIQDLTQKLKQASMK